MESQKSVFVPEEGYESGSPPDKLCGVVNEIFKGLI